MSPIAAIAGRIDIDEYMKGFLKTFFERGGAGVGGILTVKARLSQEQRDDVRDVMESRISGPANWHKNLILDNTESTYTPLGLNRGLRDALPQELDAVGEARIAMAFGIPGSILGLKIGYESSSYANKRQDWQVLWDLKMTPMLSDMDDVLNLKIVPEFGGIDEVAFDLSDIRALQEDVDKIQERHRKNWESTLESFEEARDGLGLDPNPKSGTFKIAANMTPIRVPLPPAPAPLQLPPAQPEPEPAAVAIVDEARCECGRLLGKNLNEGGLVWCGRCKKDVPIGA
jgi:phage portal protein BeeE